ncbi:TetR/AcrR family transcriptional regulator [Streptacidiphilus monticola]|jgi:AcrR family transcriptional regulator|uniref:TetR/AcrR family transcriptional regulator n=1 Tax=Streptacidiphilus monticola TaxID=2161674 RepID=A0ABW1FWW6_9ACTN
MRPDQATAAATVPAPKAKRMPRAQREQLMLDAAVSVFAKSGYHSASMDEIAEAGGVSKPMLYLYLGSKEELFAACLRREAGGLVAAFRDAAAPQLPPGDQLFGGLVAFFRFVGERRDSWALLNQHARSSGGEPVVAEVGQVRRQVVAAVTALVRRAVGSGVQEDPTGRDRGEAAAIAEAIVGAADALARWVAETGGEPPEDSARRLMSVLWIGLEPRMRGARFVPATPSN